MKPFDFRAYLKKNPLLKEGQQNFSGFAPGDDSFWDQVYDAAVSQFPEEAEAIEGVISRPSRVMQALEADGEVDEAVDYVLDSLELGEPKGMGATQKAHLYNPTNQVGFNPFRNKGSMMEKLSQGGNVVSIDLDMGWDDSDPEEDKWAKASFKKYHIKVSKIDDIPGNYKVTGTKENILNYLKSDYYDMDQEDIEEYYPELLAKDSFIQANRDAEGMPGSKMYEAKETKLFYVDLDTADFEDEDFQKELKAKKIKTKVVEEDGPGGGWPVIRYIADKKTLRDLVAKHWGEGDKEQTELYADDIKPMKKGIKEGNPLGNTGYDTDTDAQNWYNTEGIDDEEPVSDYSRRRRDTDDSFIQAQRLAAGEPDEDDDYDDGSDFPDEREMFLGQGGQEILDNIKYLIGTGFELEDIIKQIQQSKNYFNDSTNY